MAEESAGALQIIASRALEILSPRVPDAAVEAHHDYLEIYVPPDGLETAARALRNALGYAFLSMVTAVDYPDRIEVVYVAYALDHPHGVFLKTRLPRPDLSGRPDESGRPHPSPLPEGEGASSREELPKCPTLTTVWPGAEFQEREVYDLMGVNFVGHPDLRRILTEDDFPGHPLRKDFSIEPDYVLMRHLRHGVEGQLRNEE